MSHSSIACFAAVLGNQRPVQKKMPTRHLNELDQGLQKN